MVQAKGPRQVAIQCGIAVPETRFANVPPRYNAAPSQELWAIRQNHDTGQRSLDLLTWGLVPHWAKQKPKPPPINAKAETVHTLPMVRDAYARRRDPGAPLALPVVDPCWIKRLVRVLLTGPEIVLDHRPQPDQRVPVLEPDVR